jgi:hypothetical protein
LDACDDLLAKSERMYQGKRMAWVTKG